MRKGNKNPGNLAVPFSNDITSLLWPLTLRSSIWGLNVLLRTWQVIWKMVFYNAEKSLVFLV